VFFAIIPNVSVLVNGRFGPEISFGNDIVGDWGNCTVFTANDEFQMIFSGAFDQMRQFFQCESQGT
jgi:hypothetical protein